MNVLAQGGIFLIPLFICSIILLAVIIERFIVFAKITKLSLQQYSNPEMEVKKLREKLIVLHTIITISPMLGLIGTVLGLMKSFNLLGISGVSRDPSQISVGISEALITTAAGLIIAVIGIVFYNYFTSKLESYIATYNITLQGEANHEKAD